MLSRNLDDSGVVMMLDDRDSSYEINPLNRIEDEHPFFIIEIVGEPTYG